MTTIEETPLELGGGSTSAPIHRTTSRKKALWATFVTVMRTRSSLIGIATLIAIIVFIIDGQLLTPFPPTATYTGAANSAPSLAHPFGTNYLGQDLFSQVVFGAFPTFSLAMISALISVGVGFIAGLFSGYYSKLEGLVGGTTDIFLTFPVLPIIVLVGELYPASDLVVALWLGILLWPPLARAVRAQVLSLKQRPYVEAAKTSGMGNLRIVSKIILRQVVFLAVAYLVINLSISTVIVTAIEFLGVGNPNAINLGTILYSAQQNAFIAGAWWWVLAPGILITLFAVSLSLIGFSLENILNPRLRR